MSSPLVIQPDEAAACDTFFREYTPDAGYPTDWGLLAGVEYQKPSYYKERFLMKWDISSISGATVLSTSKLEAKVYVRTNFSGENVVLNRITDTGWTEDATWNDKDGSNPWASAGGDYSTPTVTFAGPTADGWQILVDGASFATWLQNALDVQGGICHMLFKLETEPSDSEIILGIHSATYATAAERPKLTVDYTTPAGVGQPMRHRIGHTTKMEPTMRGVLSAIRPSGLAVPSNRLFLPG